MTKKISKTKTAQTQDGKDVRVALSINAQGFSLEFQVGDEKASEFSFLITESGFDLSSTPLPYTEEERKIIEDLLQEIFDDLGLGELGLGE